MNNKRYLVCLDDEPQILKSLERLLRKQSYSLLTTTKADEALEFIAKNPVHVVISDFRMEGITGLQFLRNVREKFPHVVRIILSGYADENLINSALRDGDVHAYLLKPFSSEKLIKEIELFFSQYKNQGGT